MTKKILFFIAIFNFSYVVFGQCAYTGTPLTQAGGTITFCIDNTNTQSVLNVKAGQFILVNVVKGFTYTFSVGDVLMVVRMHGKRI